VKKKAAHSTNEVSVLILYAKTDEETFPDSSNKIIGNRISVKTLDLNQDFPSIQEQLNKIIKDWDPSLKFVPGLFSSSKFLRQKNHPLSPSPFNTSAGIINDSISAEDDPLRK
jgi:hypothetical protein